VVVFGRGDEETVRIGDGLLEAGDGLGVALGLDIGVEEGDVREVVRDDGDPPRREFSGRADLTSIE
jgi:hypothetical protein